MKGLQIWFEPQGLKFSEIGALSFLIITLLREITTQHTNHL